MVTPTTRFNKARSLRHSISLPIKVQKILLFMELAILKQKNSFVCCSSNQNVPDVDENFSRAFKQMSNQHQVQYYVYLVQFANDRKSDPKNEIQQTFVTFDGFCRKDGRFSNTWEKSRLEICANQFKLTIVGIKIETVILRNYLIRKSGDKNKHALVLMETHSDKTVRIGFLDWMTLNKCMNMLLSLIKVSHGNNLFQENVKTQNNFRIDTPKNQSRQKNIISIKTNKKNNESVEFKVYSKQILAHDYPIPIAEIDRENDIFQQLSHNTQQSLSSPLLSIIKKKQNLDVFSKIMPGYNLQKLQQDFDYRLIRYNDSHKIYQHNILSNKFKLVQNLPFDKNRIVHVISNVLSYESFNDQVSVADVKLDILSENSMICYQSHHPYQEFYYPRDYLYLRHLFNWRNKTYIIDKGVETRSYPAFGKVVRGQMVYGLWMVEQMEGHSKLVLQIEINHKGQLNQFQNESLTLRYVEGITKINEFLSSNKYAFNDKVFNEEWELDENQNNLERGVRKRGLSKISRNASEFSESIEESVFQVNICEEVQEFYTIEDIDQPFNESLIVPKNSGMELKEITNPIVRVVQFDQRYTFDNKGKLKVPSNYLTQKWRMKPERSLEKPSNKKDAWNDLWTVENGKVKFKQSQTFNMLSMALKHSAHLAESDLFKGKRVYDLHLPIDAYGKESFLEVLARSLSLVPKLLKDNIETLTSSEKVCSFLAVGFSSSLMIGAKLIHKTFNPLLGETYQGWIDGCPIYCQQTSLTPSVSSFLFKAKDYTIYGKVQPKAELVAVNKLAYSFKGEYTLQLKTGEKIFFCLPQIEYIGLQFGQIFLNLRQTCCAFYPQEQLYAEIVFPSSPESEQTNDQIKGGVYKIRGVSMKHFQQLILTRNQTIKSIVDKSENLCAINGRWTSHLIIGNTCYYQISKDPPYHLKEQDFPLSSDSNYRQDIAYLREDKIIKAQIAKQKLQLSQKCDNKLRQKMLK